MAGRAPWVRMWKALACSALKGAFADLSRGLFGVLGVVKTTALLGFTLAAYNLDSIRSFKAKHGLDDDAQVVEEAQAAPGSSALGDVGRDRREQSGSPVDVAARDSRSHKPAHQQGPASARPEEAPSGVAGV